MVWKKNWKKILLAILAALFLFWVFLWPQTLAGARVLIRDDLVDREVTGLEHKTQLIEGFERVCTADRDCSDRHYRGHGAGGNPAVVIIRGNDLIGYTMKSYKVVGTDPSRSVGYIGYRESGDIALCYEVPLEEYEALRKLGREMEKAYPIMEN
ncbi:MAG: hypothetical protein E7223_00765 [Clostridiales bacterium]|nr:hypothetical protein [Clostridiales bacterium]